MKIILYLPYLINLIFDFEEKNMSLLATENKLLNATFRKFLIGTAIAVVCSILGFIANGIIIGNFFGKVGLAAFGLTIPIVYGALAIGYIFSYGGSIVCSNNISNKDRANNNFTVVCLTALITGVLITLFLILFTKSIAHVLGASGESLIPTVDYMNGLFIGILPTIFIAILTNYSRIDGFPTLGLKEGLILFVSNVLLDFIFILIFKTGIYGIGLGTSLSNYLATLYLIMHFISKKSSFKFKKDLEFKQELIEVFKTGLPSALNQVYNMVRTVITNKLAIMVSGLIFLGALSVQSNVYMLLCGLGVGIGTTTLALGGIFYGDNDRMQLEQTLRLSIGYTLICDTLIAVIMFIFAPYFVYAFGKNPEVYATAIRGLRIFAFSLPFGSLCYVFLNFYNATKQLKLANYISFAHSFLFLTLFATTLAFLIGGDGIWISFVLCEIVTLLTIPIILKFKTKKFPKSINDLILIDEDQFPEEDTFIAYIKSEKELLGIIKNLDENLDGNTLNEKVKLRIQLILEEMGLNILNHAYNEDEEKYINIRIKYKNTENVIIYFQDNGIPFDLKKDYENNADYYGIAIIKEISSDVNYNYNVKLNNNKVIIPIND